MLKLLTEELAIPKKKIHPSFHVDVMANFPQFKICKERCSETDALLPVLDMKLSLTSKLRNLSQTLKMLNLLKFLIIYYKTKLQKKSKSLMKEIPILDQVTLLTQYLLFIHSLIVLQNNTIFREVILLNLLANLLKKKIIFLKENKEKKLDMSIDKLEKKLENKENKAAKIKM